MNRQRGVALTGLLLWGLVITLVAILGIRVTPEVIDFYKIRHAVKATAAKSAGKSVAEIRQDYGKFAEVEHIKTITPADLEIFKQDNDVVIAFAYESRIPLFANVSLLLDFQSSASARDSGQ